MGVDVAKPKYFEDEVRESIIHAAQYFAYIHNKVVPISVYMPPEKWTDADRQRLRRWFKKNHPGKVKITKRFQGQDVRYL